MIIAKKQAGAVEGFRNLICWQRADELANLVYISTTESPKNELYGITSQLRRAAISVVLNIIEGYARDSKNEFRRFLTISLGSLAETGYLLDFSYKQGYFSKETYAKLVLLREEVGRILWSLYQSKK